MDMHVYITPARREKLKELVERERKNNPSGIGKKQRRASMSGLIGKWIDREYKKTKGE
jgi:hypothetical protein